MTSQSKKSSSATVPITNLSFPEIYTQLKGAPCQIGNVCKRRTLRPMQSADLGVPQFLSGRKPTYQSSGYTSPSMPTTPGSMKTIFKKKQSTISTSRDLIDTKHKTSVKGRHDEFKPPCLDSVIIGAPVSYIGKCPGKDKKRFKLTEDPRKIFCLKNPNRIHFKPVKQLLELEKIREFVKTAQNVASGSESNASNSSICEVIDLANPLGLDFQGTDFKNTYGKDEQTIQNQIEYRKVRRFQHRRNVKTETAYLTEKQQHADRVAIPKVFEIDGKSMILPPIGGKPTLKVAKRISKVLHDIKHPYGKLVRAEQKPEAVYRFKKEEELRRERYKQLYLKKKAKMAEKEEEEKLAKKVEAEQKPIALAQKDIQELVNFLNRDITLKSMEPRRIPERKKFPHTIEEALKFRHEMKKSKRVLRDKAIVKQDFYKEIGVTRHIPEASLVISSDSESPVDVDNEEQSSNDEDDMVVGKRGSKCFIRGYRYKMGPNLRGKYNTKANRKEGKVKGCITRTEWFESLVPKANVINLNKDTEPTLFPPELGLKPLYPTSAIQEFRKKPLGRHYDRTIRKRFNIKKPKSIKIRKFNLIGYLYGAPAKNTRSKISLRGSEQLTTLNSNTRDYIRQKMEKAAQRERIQKRRRLHYLGIPCPPEEKKRKSNVRCVDSDSGDSDWIPDETAKEYVDPPGHIPQAKRGNMPASQTRETTLRRHPRHFRGYELYRVPSPILNKYIKEEHYPVLLKLKDDIKIMENLRKVEDTEYARKFEARYHHDHWNPTQHKSVNVRYARKIAKPKLEEPQVNLNTTRVRTFDKARPRGSNVDDDQDFSMIKVDVDKIIKDHKSSSAVAAKGRQIEKDVIQVTKDKIVHSLEEGELQEFPGRDKFLEFISEIKSQLDKRAGITSSELAIDQKAYIDELKEDLQSIQSCLTSLSSSECTNLSDDSGSFLMATNKKIPLDYLRKSVVPFEEMNRNRIEALPIDADEELQNPFRTVPFAGQQKEQLAMTAARDNFFTFNTRLQNGMRQRLEVKTEDPKKKLLGPVGLKRKSIKAVAQVATDIDELYIEDLKKPTPLKPFKFNTCRTMIKDALRKKFESLLIQGEIVRAKINDRRNEEYYQQMMKSKELFEKLFAKWEKKEYEAAMEVVNKVKPYYEATDVYRKEHQELSKQYTVLNMDIVYIENDWTRRTILQNFHYLLADMEWRVEHDWIHRTPDGNLEGFEESIAKRSTVNIRQRDKDDAWAIKEYYEEHYLKNPHPIIVVFANEKEFAAGIENLKSKTFALLLELHYTLWILAELEQRYLAFSDWCKIELESKKKFAENKCANKYFMEDRAKKLREQMDIFLGKPIEETFGDERMSQMKGICSEIYKDLVPVADQMELSTLEQVAAVSDVLNDLMATLENIPVSQRVQVEKNYRKTLAYQRNMSKQAVFIERRIASEMVKVRRNMAPPFVKPKRPAKLPRSHLKKKVEVKEERHVSLSLETKFFFQAFNEEGCEPGGLDVARDSLDVIEVMQQSITPFYFDHFLILNGYQPSYDFKTQVEMRDGPEIARLQKKELLPEVIERFEQWEANKKRIMEENISRNPHIYQNVRI